ncbi:MAG: hypothetical protein M1831_006909 [Alyxoria varia]|nr:MAG: hypothetical protein M1831_006909 [Alyxoria varia]
MLQSKWFILCLLRVAVASPALLVARDKKPFEWTALGDSYASGVGSSEYVEGKRCLRYDQAYPVLMNNDPTLAEGEHIFHNAVCSGAEAPDVEAYQFYDEDTSGKPNSQYGLRPKFGDPQMATLAVGGDDIDFPGLLANCIIEWNVFGAIPHRSCDDQKKLTWSKLKSPDLVDSIDHLIKKTVRRGRSGSIGDEFRLYVTGYAEFFNAEDPACDDVTFARSANPNPDGKDHIKMTKELRKDFNSMSRHLNSKIEEAVNRNKDQRVVFIDIQGEGTLDGHRFCEPGIKEPDQKNGKLWFWHYPYNEPRDDGDAALKRATENVTKGLSTKELSSKYPSTADYNNALFDALESNDPEGDALIWPVVGRRAKVFHPQVPFHTHIKNIVIKQYWTDWFVDQNVKKLEDAGIIRSRDQNQCHGIKGQTWVMHRDKAVQNAKDFCAQESKSVEYNKDSVDHLRLSVSSLGDSEAGPKDAPDCEGRFIRAVIDGCDGDDKINNPYNYKFGGRLQTTDGWSFVMEPLSRQEILDSCDVSYKFFFNGFRIRGMNFPDAKLGKNGDGLWEELSGCGKVTEWSFEWTPDDAKYQWYAQGKLPIGTKACVGRAVESAGGSSRGNCHGAGKV